MGFWDSIKSGLEKVKTDQAEMVNRTVVATIANVTTVAKLTDMGKEQVSDVFKMAQEMIEISEKIRNDSRLLSFQNYTRFYVSVKFLQDLVSQREKIKSPTDINLVFLNLIQKFLTNSISDSELLELDEQIQQL